MKIFLVKVLLKLEIYIKDSVLKTNLWNYKIKDLNAETIIGNNNGFYERELLLSILELSYYPEPENIRDKVKVVLNFSNYGTKKELDHATGVGTSDLGDLLL